jgi:ribonuclease Z
MQFKNMKMQLVFLGTACMVPTKERNHISTFLGYKSHGILVDCGEGTQRQMKMAGLKLTKITKILISHWHGDHVLGLPGLLQSLSMSDYNKGLEIYGPVGTKKRIKDMLGVFVFNNNIEIKIFEIKEKKIFENKDFYVEAFELEHTTKCFGFRFVEKDIRKINLSIIKKLGIPEGRLLGKLQNNKSIVFKGKRILPKDTTYFKKGKIVSFICDSLLVENCFKIAKDADVLVCESAYSSKLEDKATEYAHLTAKQAGLIANKANVRRLILTHFSARYKDSQEVLEDVKDVFDNVVCAYDLMKINI